MRIPEARFFVPSRLLLAVAAMAVAAAFSAAGTADAKPFVILVADASQAGGTMPHDGEVDLIVTGNTLATDERAEWEEKRRKFLECGLCGKEQPFPDDLPAAWSK